MSSRIAISLVNVVAALALLMEGREVSIYVLFFSLSFEKKRISSGHIACDISTLRQGVSLLKIT